jgi:hypothetical protein
MSTSPDIANLSIGKGIVKFTPDGGAERDLGEVSEFETTPNIDILDYFSSRSGISKKVKSVVRTTSLELRMVMNEITAENLALQLLGEVSEVTTGQKTFRIMSESAVSGVLTFTGTNDVGNRIDITLDNVTFRPSGSFSPLSEEWQAIEVTGEALATEYTDGTSDFGSVSVTDEA